MKVNEPIGDAVFAPLFIRITLGGYFVLAGLSKIDHIPEFVQKVQGYHVLPDQLSMLYATLLPYVEIGAGALMIIGFWTTLASLITSLMLLSFLIALGFFSEIENLYRKDVILLATSISLMFSGGGAYSVDKFRKNG